MVKNVDLTGVRKVIRIIHLKTQQVACSPVYVTNVEDLIKVTVHNDIEISLNNYNTIRGLKDFVNLTHQQRNPNLIFIITKLSCHYLEIHQFCFFLRGSRGGGEEALTEVKVSNSLLTAYYLRVPNKTRVSSPPKDHMRNSHPITL